MKNINIFTISILLLVGLVLASPLQISISPNATSVYVGFGYRFINQTTGGTSPYTFSYPPNSSDYRIINNTFMPYSNGVYNISETATDSSVPPSTAYSNNVMITVGNIQSATYIFCPQQTVDHPITCKIIVSGYKILTGSVAFNTSSPTGSFSNNTCAFTSNSAECYVTYLDTNIGTAQITAKYSGDSHDIESSATNALTIVASTSTIPIQATTTIQPTPSSGPSDIVIVLIGVIACIIGAVAYLLFFRYKRL